MSQHNIRKGERANHSDPINFTCGKCFKVVPFQEDYKCCFCDVEEVKEEPA